MPGKRKLTDEHRQEIVAAYQTKETARSIAERYGVDPSRVVQLAKRAGVPRKYGAKPRVVEILLLTPHVKSGVIAKQLGISKRHVLTIRAECGFSKRKNIGGAATPDNGGLQSVSG